MRVIVGKAMAAIDNNKYPHLEIHAVLIFVNSDNHEDAAIIAHKKMKQLNWQEVKMDRIGTLDINKFNSQDPTIIDSFESALESGFSAIIYTGIVDSF